MATSVSPPRVAVARDDRGVGSVAIATNVIEAARHLGHAELPNRPAVALEHTLVQRGSTRLGQDGVEHGHVEEAAAVILAATNVLERTLPHELDGRIGRPPNEAREGAGRLEDRSCVRVEFGHREGRGPRDAHLGDPTLERRAINVEARKQEDTDLDGGVLAERVDRREHVIGHRALEAPRHERALADVAIASRTECPWTETELLDELHRIAAKQADRLGCEAGVEVRRSIQLYERMLLAGVMTDREADGIPSVLPRSRPWPFLIGLVIVLGAIAFFVVRSMRTPQPLRVLIAIDLDGKWWEGSAPAAALADRLAQRMTKLGFEPVRAGDPEVSKTLDKYKSPIDAARKLHAAFVITADIAPSTIEHKLPKGAYYESRADAPVFVQHIDGKPVEAGRLATFGGAREKPRALEMLAIGLADQAFDAVLPALFGEESIKEMLADRQSNIAPQIYPARDFVLARDKAMRDAKEAWDALRKKHLDEEFGASKPIYLSQPGAQDELAAVGKGSVLVATNSVRPWFSPDTRNLGWITELETLEWRPIDGPSQIAFRGYNIFGYPHGTSDRSVLIEDLFGWAKTVTVIDGSKSRRVRVDPEHRFVDPHLSPDGKRIAVWDRPSQSEAGALLVLSADDGGTLLELDREGGSFNGLTWIDGGHLAFLHTGSELPDEAHRLVVDNEKVRQGLYFADFTVAPAALSKGHGVPEGETWAFPSASGDLLAFERHDGAVSLYKRSDNTIVSRSFNGFARSPSFSPDGQRLTFELTGEIAIADVAGGPAKMLTKNSFRDRYPQFSADGKHVFYETLDDDPNYPGRRRVSWIAAVALP